MEIATEYNMPKSTILEWKEKLLNEAQKLFIPAYGVCQQRCRLKVKFFILSMHIHTDAPRPRFVICHRPCHPGIPAQTDSLLPYIAHLICLSH